VLLSTAVGAGHADRCAERGSSVRVLTVCVCAEFAICSMLRAALQMDGKKDVFVIMPFSATASCAEGDWTEIFETGISDSGCTQHSSVC